MIRIENLVHQYTLWESDSKKSKKTVLDGISLDIPSGQFLAILGPNGCGKSTLAKHLNGLLLPREGTVWIDGKNTVDAALLWQIRQQVGMVFQNPDNQIIGTSVEEDTAFGPENHRIPPEEICRRVTESLAAVKLSHKRKASPSRLSGGQKQRLAVAGTIADAVQCIVLDEPTAMLDPNSRRDVLKLVHTLNREKGITIVLITHHTDEVVDADSIVLMDRGRILCQGTPREIFSRPELLAQVKMDMPQITDLCFRLAEQGVPLENPVLRQAEFAAQLSRLLPKGTAVSEVISEENTGSEPALLEVKNISYTYGVKTAGECRVLEDISLKIRPGECVGLIGASGSGKTTLIKHLNGLLKAGSGDILFEGQSIYRKKYNLTQLRKEVGLVFQYPEHQLFGSTVLADTCFGPLNLGMSKQEAEKAAKQSLALVDIGADKYYVNPLELSGGEKRRVAIAGVLAMNPRILVLDEPAAGLDPQTRAMIFQTLTRIKEERQLAIVLVSHHMEDVAEYADRVLVLDQGRLAITGSPRQVFEQTETLRQLGIGIPQITAATQALLDAGLALPRCAVTVEDAEKMLLKLYRGEEAHLVP